MTVTTRWLYCVEFPQYIIRLEALPFGHNTLTASKRNEISRQLLPGELKHVGRLHVLYPTSGRRGSDGPLDHRTGDHVTSGHHMSEPGQSRPSATGQ